ncbi:cation acetate symporter [Nocardiopsis sp. MT53]|uniref:Cation acetate symporter n=2 Tax=Nocardiopsidaceae TaxID=83676 RepID=A0ABX8BQV7_9ACTN|nr:MULTISPECIES: cation acetate symporter [Nocardiopsis]QUX24605.1 cation acetate symporter [Nocardiopsis changdeensis]QYX34993.1 cation acetate symporter [Nocardiopsis sp. MT53]
MTAAGASGMIGAVTGDGTAHLLAAPTALDGRFGAAHAWTIGLCALFVLVTLAITIRARRTTRGAVDYYAGGRGFSSTQNGLALTGDYLSAASFLGIAGMISLQGYDGFLYSIGFLVAWLLVLPMAQLMRNTGRFTMADLPAFRMRRMRVRLACTVSTVIVCVFYLVAQMVGAGALVSVLLGLHDGGTFLGVDAAQARTGAIVLVGVLMIVYVMYGGMKAATWLQIIKAVVLLGATGLLTVLVLAMFSFDPRALLGAAADASGHGPAFLEPGLGFGVEVPGEPATTMFNKLDLISLGLALVLGTVALPHILIRFYTVPDGRSARSSVNRAILMVGAFYLMTLALGFGAAALVGSERILALDPSGNSAVPMLAEELGRLTAGPVGAAVLLALISAVALATILAVIASLTLASSSSIAHDLFGHILMWGRPRESQEVAVARFSACLIGAVAIALAVQAQEQNVAFLVGLAFAIAAAANLPVIVLTMFWRRFNTKGVEWGIYGGLASTLLLMLFSPVMSGKTDPATGENLSVLPSWIDIGFFPLENPALIAVPVGFACAVVGSLLSPERNSARFTELRVRSLTGWGADQE